MTDGRECTRCKTWKTAGSFKIDLKASTGLDCWCRPCRAENARERYAANPEPHRASVRKWHHDDPERSRLKRRQYTLKRMYGLSMDDFAEMLNRQGGKCAICRCDEPRGVNWHVDHDHVSGTVRAILCHPCNVALGNASDSPERLIAMATYLLSFQDVLERFGTDG